MPTTTEMARAQGVPIVDYDHNSDAYGSRHIEIAREMAEKTPVAWSEAQGGFWIFSGYDYAYTVLDDWRLFSSERKNGNPLRRGVSIPQLPVELPLNMSDPPLHTSLRMIEAPFFTPKNLHKWVAAAENFTRDSIDRVIESGHCDMVEDICGRVPVMTTLFVAGADPEEWEFYSNPLAFSGGPGGEVFLGEVMRKLNAILADRRITPRDDIATALANAHVDGEPLPNDTAVGMLHTLMTGGFDTAISLLCDIFNWLEEHPDRRDWLREHPEALDNAVDEFMRVFPPVLNLVRTATRDMDLGGVTLRDGDWVAVSVHAANRDPRHYDNPLEIDFERENARDQLSFSGGNHRCLGAPLARIEMRHVIGEVLRRMPDYRIDRTRARRKPGVRPTTGWETMPVSFTPGKREG